MIYVFFKIKISTTDISSFMISCDHSINGIFATILKFHMGKKSEVFVE